MACVMYPPKNAATTGQYDHHDATTGDATIDAAAESAILFADSAIDRQDNAISCVGIKLTLCVIFFTCSRDVVVVVVEVRLVLYCENYCYLQ